jgi:hypothetical protein
MGGLERIRRLTLSSVWVVINVDIDGRWLAFE